MGKFQLKTHTQTRKKPENRTYHLMKGFAGVTFKQNVRVLFKFVVFDRVYRKKKYLGSVQIRSSDSFLNVALNHYLKL